MAACRNVLIIEQIGSAMPLLNRKVGPRGQIAHRVPRSDLAGVLPSGSAGGGRIGTHASRSRLMASRALAGALGAWAIAGLRTLSPFKVPGTPSASVGCQPALERRMGRIAFGAIVAAGLLGLFVLVVGWLLDVGVARTLIPGSNATKANAALGVVLLAAAMILERGPGSRIRRWIADGCCLTSAGLGAAALIEYAINVDLGIDELLVADKASAHDLPMPGMMAAPTAACFVLLGVAILLRRRWGRQRPWMWQVLAIAVTVLSFVILLGHLYGASAFYALSVPTRTAAPAAIMLALIGAAMLLEGPFVGIMEPSVSSGPGGMLVRRFLPIVLVGVPTVGWFVLEGENRGFYRGPVGHALAATVATLTLSAVIIGVALSLNRVDAARAEKAEAFQAITDSAQDAIVSCDRRGGIVYVNEAGARMF